MSNISNWAAADESSDDEVEQETKPVAVVETTTASVPVAESATDATEENNETPADTENGKEEISAPSAPAEDSMGVFVANLRYWVSCFVVN